jgi:hypothetical protein
MNDSIFQEKTRFGDAEICPYVLILDGWDEISVAVNEGFEIEVGRMPKNVRDEFLRPRATKIASLSPAAHLTRSSVASSSAIKLPFLPSVTTQPTSLRRMPLR